MPLQRPFAHAALLNSGYNTREEKHGSARISARICRCAYGRGIVSVDDLCAAASRRRRRTKGARFQSRAAAERNRTTASPRQGPALGKQRSVSVPVACLRVSGENPQCYLSTALLLLLRPRHGTQEPAQLLRRHSRCAMLNLHEGALLFVSNDQAAQDRGPDSQKHYRRRVEDDWSAVGYDN